MSEKKAPGNPFLEDTNYFEGYEEKLKDMRDSSPELEFNKLCYYVFGTELGRKLLSEFKDRFLIPGFASPAQVNPGEGALYYEGFKQAFRMIIQSIKSHESAIKAGVVKE